MLKLSKNKVNKELYQSVIKHLLYTYFNYNKDIKININNEYLIYNCFYPLPTKLIVNETENNIIENNNIYATKNNNLTSRKILFGNRVLPIANKDPIPFSFPIIINNEIEILNSTIYYYELTILENVITNYSNQLFCVGYGSINTITESFIGNDSNSIGYNINTGTIFHNNMHYYTGLILNTNDIIGVGIVYLDNKYKPFFTHNGSLIDIILPEINIDETILPIIEYNYSNKIKLNFSQEEFKCNIKYLNTNNNILSQKNNFLKVDKNLSNINTHEILKNKKKIIPFFLFSDNFNTILQNINF